MKGLGVHLNCGSKDLGGRGRASKKSKEKILHVFSITIVFPYKAATQKGKNVTQTVFQGLSDAIQIISPRLTQPDQFRFKRFHLRKIIVYLTLVQPKIYIL